MKQIFSLLPALVVLSSLQLFAQQIIHVSPEGNDEWTGKPSGTAGDGPVRTIHRALSLAAARNTPPPKGGIVIALAGGDYRIEKSLRIGEEHSGTAASPLVIRGAHGNSTRLLGSRRIHGFRHVENPAVRSRLSARADDSVLVARLPETGITEYGVITPRSSPGLELFCRGQRMTLARWPNEGWLRIADVPQSGDTLRHPGLAREKRFDGVPAGRHFGRITYDGDRPSGWAPDPNIVAHGYWTFDWSDAYQPVASISPASREVTFAPPHHGYGYTKNQRYAFVNVLEELDSPGEWYLDRQNGLLYFWPPSPDGAEHASASVLDGPFFAIDEASEIRLERLSFEEGRSGALTIRGSNHVQVSGCTMRALGGTAVVVSGGEDVLIQSCDLSDLALGGITSTGGDRKTLRPGRHTVRNNHIHHYGQWVRTGQYAVILHGVGGRMANNLVHDAPFEAVYVTGNDHIIEYNDISRVMQESGDAGALHTGRNWTWQGNIVRYNYFHHLQGPGLHGVMGVYIDDWGCGWTITGNIFYKAGRATLIGGGRHNRVENNIYIECAPSIHLDARGLGWAGYYFEGYPRVELFTSMQEIHYNNPPYRTRYPNLLQMYDGETQVPKYNTVTRNLSWGGRWMDIYDFWAFDPRVFTITGNVIGDEDLLRRRGEGLPGWDPYYIDIDLKEGYDLLKRDDPRGKAFFQGNRVSRGVEGGIEPRSGRVTLPPSAYPEGFTPIPVERIGLYKDQFRTLAGR